MNWGTLKTKENQKKACLQHALGSSLLITGKQHRIEVDLHKRQNSAWWSYHNGLCCQWRWPYLIHSDSKIQGK